MPAIDLVELGSQTARNGFRNEDDIINKFNNWISDKDAQKWLMIMGYSLREIEDVKAVKVTGQKTDVQVRVFVKVKKVWDVQNLAGSTEFIQDGVFFLTRGFFIA